MRVVVLESETSGLDPDEGASLVEIVCLEMVDDKATGIIFHRLIKPRVPITADFSAIIGITNEDVSNSATFEDVVDDFLEFLANSAIVVHGKYPLFLILNFELELLGRSKIEIDRDVIDILPIARSTLPNGRCSLSGLSERFGLEIGSDVLPDAMKSAKLLSEIYLKLKLYENVIPS